MYTVPISDYHVFSYIEQARLVQSAHWNSINQVKNYNILSNKSFKNVATGISIKTMLGLFSHFYNIVNLGTNRLFGKYYNYVGIRKTTLNYIMEKV